jgi:molybdate transport system substrate-binding protein
VFRTLLATRLLPGLLALGLVLPALPAPAQTLTVFAAASLKDAIEAIVRGYTADAGTRVVSSFAASSALARQIERGAPADVFISADHEWMDYLAKRNKIDGGSRSVLAGNRLVLISPASSPLNIALVPGFPLAATLGAGRLAIGDPEHVPAGRYARAALAHLGVWDSVRSKLAAADNVRAALNFVARGEAPLGIVYQTDAAVDARVRIVGVFPPGSHAPIEYPMAVVVRNQRPEPVRRLLAHLRSAESAAILARHGFVPVK